MPVLLCTGSIQPRIVLRTSKLTPEGNPRFPDRGPVSRFRAESGNGGFPDPGSGPNRRETGIPPGPPRFPPRFPAKPGFQGDWELGISGSGPVDFRCQWAALWLSGIHVYVPFRPGPQQPW
jgi:hypothetical protein